MLTILNSTPRIRKFLTYDLEWVPGSLQVRIAGVYDDSRYRCYRTLSAFLDCELTSKNRGKWFYAHAGGLADFLFLAYEFTKRPDYEVSGSFSGSSLIIAHVKRGHNTWHFVDSFWLLRKSLAKIAKWVGMKKGGPKDESEFQSVEEYQAYVRHWYATVSEHELIEYNALDCEILWRAIDAFENVILELGGQLQMTLASTAMSLFRRAYLQHPIATSDVGNRIAKEAYFASRVEVFAHDCNQAYYYDMNSCFPHAMTSPQPGEVKRWRVTLEESLLADAESRPFLVRADIRSPDSYVPTTPIRVDGRVFFPVGEWQAWLTGVDVALLLESGGSIQKVYDVIEYEPFHDLANFVNDIYERRMSASSEAEKEVYKLISNNLYGKFAEEKEKAKLHINPPEHVLARLTQDMLKIPGVWLEPIEAQVEHAHVPIAANVTAIARRNLYRYLSAASECYYCDTDGFAIDAPLYQDSKELGKVKLEKTIDGESDFIGPKNYRLHTPKGLILRAKGFSLGPSDEAGYYPEHGIAAKRFEELARGLQVSVEHMVRIRENLIKGSLVPTEQTLTKALNKAIIEKRFFYPDGQSRPWHISELPK